MLKRAFNITLPVFFGYLFMGIAFGILLQKAGYNFIWAFFISLIVYAGSMQFIMISFFGGGISLLSVALMTLTINGRHIFYGLSFIEKFKSMGGWYYPYMIFSLTDETYSLLCGINNSEAVDWKKLFFTIAAMNHSYWIAGCTIGAIFGEMITFNTTGIDFAMTAIFVVIFVEQWLSADNHGPACVGIACGLGALIIFGANNFVLPSLLLAVISLLLLKNKMEAESIDD